MIPFGILRTIVGYVLEARSINKNLLCAKNTRIKINKCPSILSIFALLKVCIVKYDINIAMV